MSSIPYNFDSGFDNFVFVIASIAVRLKKASPSFFIFGPATLNKKDEKFLFFQKFSGGGFSVFTCF